MTLAQLEQWMEAVDALNARDMTGTPVYENLLELRRAIGYDAWLDKEDKATMRAREMNPDYVSPVETLMEMAQSFDVSRQFVTKPAADGDKEEKGVRLKKK